MSNHPSRSNKKRTTSLINAGAALKGTQHPSLPDEKPWHIFISAREVSCCMDTSRQSTVGWLLVAPSHTNRASRSLRALRLPDPVHSDGDQ